MAKKKVTIKDIAKAADVSGTTVSRYLNGKFAYMSVETKENIKAVIAELNYRPSNIARSLKSQKSMLLGAVIADIENPFSNTIIKGLSDQTHELGYSLMIAVSNSSKEQEQEHIQRFIDNQVDGLIINTVGNNEEYLEALKEKDIPVVLLDKALSNEVFDCITSNNQDLSQELTQHLVEEGFKSFGYFTPSLKANLVQQKRYAGIKKTLSQFEDIQLNRYTTNKEEKNFLPHALEEFFQLPEPRVLIAANGLILLNVLKEIEKTDKKIGKDYGICGFDDILSASIIHSGITTVAQNSYGLGKESGALLINRINENQKGGLVYKELPGKLKIRQSTRLNEG